MKKEPTTVAEYIAGLDQVTTHSGMCWSWAEGFTRDQAYDFLKWLEANRYEHRGVYRLGGDYSVRYRK